MLVSKYKKYNESESLGLYTTYVETGDGLNEVVSSIVPFINQISKKLYSNYSKIDDITLRALEGVYPSVRKRLLPCVEQGYSSYLYAAIKNQLYYGYIDFVRKDDKNLPLDYLPYESMEDHRQLFDRYEIEGRIFDVKEEVLDRIRFGGKEYSVCANHLDFITFSDSANRSHLFYGLPSKRVDWLKQYTLVLHRMVCKNVEK